MVGVPAADTAFALHPQPSAVFDASNRRDLRYVLLTHSHGDHAGATYLWRAERR
jgi:glyoxylase-like metal-dependent hydrolase (beta-lactamase superfamily II)